MYVSGNHSHAQGNGADHIGYLPADVSSRQELRFLRANSICSRNQGRAVSTSGNIASGTAIGS